MRASRGLVLCMVLLGGCGSATMNSAAGPASAARSTTSAASVEPSVVAASTSTSTPPPSPSLDPSRGQEIGLVFEAFMSPFQESGEEEDTPGTTPPQFRSSGTSQSRAARAAAGHRGHGMLRFNRDFSRAFVDVRVEGIDPATVNMFHIHCGRPGILGPILVDFSLATNLQQALSRGVFTVEVTDELIVRTSQHGHGPLDAFTMGCIIPSASLGSAAPSKVSTVAGMAQIAEEGELYFNLHTATQTYFGDIRGQIHRAEGAGGAASGGEGR